MKIIYPECEADKKVGFLWTFKNIKFKIRKKTKIGAFKRALASSKRI